MFAIINKKIFYILSIVLTIIALFSIFVFKLNPGIDFTGGSVLEVSFPEQKPTQEQIESSIKEFNGGNFLVRSAGENGYIIKTSTIDDTTKKSIENAISQNGQIKFVEEKFITVGPTLGEELTSNALLAVLMIVIAITLYVAYVFRSVSKPVSSWKYGFATIIALIHDVILTIGFFAILGKFFGVEIDALFVTAILVVLGYSVNDSIVVLDRVREKLKNTKEELRQSQFTELVGKSLVETVARSLNTTITTLLSLVALYFFGGEATKNFALALIVGITAGAYSSIFVAPQLLVSFYEKGKK
ncbi:MAG: protein translocase subunit SecF [Candidatus Pacebacteria bacterium]|nr:protein translocase subunit SecF [Candidatus Paceibacterota bacterium]